MTKKNRFWNVLKIILAVFMMFGGVQHFIKPTFYLPFVPTFLPFPIMIIYLSGILEIGLGILLFLNTKYAKLGALGIFYLMLLFLPVHIWDVFSATPAIGSHTAALIRLPFQFLCIAWAWKIHKEISSSIAIKNN
ncbi:DoxX family protein [Tenacibaculum finnmarkense]|uniref:DoxX family protein n=1 Tax=Tenacibaculum finnmarkense genomovar finnmarkense TaxID=1458503 RepID=A0AAP1RF30_9FLAO|nr:hypothetical protein [Tenacibaculum finnmarkense]MBE7652713.1 hypothetical protein [Tenacibaculum finnmarkense genomovar finnmarkense]MBE7695010.1 hypothetical protein [Tenacibaculum finnmarkense genomovar finnmarkense]MCD8427263.1 hypothetical protein [Tenacibaculum finnmarkense genomovar finnmarkense]MCG8731076.1 hypothetical protein [Tenacibaculum finnmarkense]MCG8751180.1 hypothetical protein [Tenacibaculum finnmarkense]